MSKVSKPLQSTEDEACEIIELAIDDLEVLTRAFKLIAEVCESKPEADIALDDRPSKIVVN